MADGATIEPFTGHAEKLRLFVEGVFAGFIPVVSGKIDECDVGLRTGFVRVNLEAGPIQGLTVVWLRNVRSLRRREVSAVKMFKVVERVGGETRAHELFRGSRGPGTAENGLTTRAERLAASTEAWAAGGVCIGNGGGGTH